MIKIDDIKKFGFKVTWDVVRLGWEGPGNFQRQLFVDQINYFADLMIIDASDAELGKIAELCTTADEQVIAEMLFHLSPEISDRALRIWRVVLLESTLSSLSNDPLYGLIELTDFWSKLGYSLDSPNIIQGVDNDLTPTEYYTQENLEKILDSHREWLKKEIKNFRGHHA